jgi:hypothetical protein
MNCGTVESERMRFSRRPVEDIGLLILTNWVAEIATSPRTLLAMTEQEKIQIPLTPFSKEGN